MPLKEQSNILGNPLVCHLKTGPGCVLSNLAQRLESYGWNRPKNERLLYLKDKWLICQMRRSISVQLSVSRTTMLSLLAKDWKQGETASSIKSRKIYLPATSEMSDLHLKYVSLFDRDNAH